MKKDITSIIIVNYNTRELTYNCIRSVQKHFTALSYEIIVVDNNSSDGSAVYLQQQFPEITVIANAANLGFGTANNIGVSKASGEFILLLNSDTIIISNVLEKFVAFYNSHRHLKPGVIGSLLLSEDHTVAHSFGNFPYPISHGLQQTKVADQKEEMARNYFAAVGIVVGAGMFMEKAVFDAFGGFDTNIFLYEEELELQYQMRKSGYTSMMLNEKSIIHLEGRSSDSFFKRRCSFLSLRYVYKKHLPFFLYLFWRVKMVLYSVIFFKNPRTSWQEKFAYLRLALTGR